MGTLSMGNTREVCASQKKDRDGSISFPAVQCDGLLGFHGRLHRLPRSYRRNHGHRRKWFVLVAGITRSSETGGGRFVD